MISGYEGSWETQWSIDYWESYGPFLCSFSMEVVMEERLLREKDIIGNPKKGIRPIISISRAQLWLKVQKEEFPQPIKGLLGPRTTVWKFSELQDYISRITLGQSPSYPAPKAPVLVKKKSGKK
jgi:predicted DNA-binding transcriptional regulator AlpA